MALQPASRSTSRTSTLSSVSDSEPSQHRSSVQSRKPTIKHPSTTNSASPSPPTHDRDQVKQEQLNDVVILDQEVVKPNGGGDRSNRRQSAFMQAIYDPRIRPQVISPKRERSTSHDTAASQRSKKAKPARSPSPTQSSPASSPATPRTVKPETGSIGSHAKLNHSELRAQHQSSPAVSEDQSSDLEIEEPEPAPVASTSARPLAASSSASTFDGPTRRPRNTRIDYAIPTLDEFEVNKPRKTKKLSVKAPGGRGSKWKADATYKTYPPPRLEPEAGVTYALQSSTCCQGKYEKYPQCHMCVNRQGGNICLFRGVRSFARNKDDPAQKPIGPPVFVSSIVDDDPANFPTRFNQPFTPAHANQIRTIAAHALLPTLRKELAHASLPDARRIKLGLAERSLCDTCLHAMFGAKHQCYLCAREQCLDCHVKLRQVEANAIEAGLSVGAFAAAHPSNEDIKRLTKCSGRRGENPIHTPSSFVALTRFKTSELSRWVQEMTDWIADHPAPSSPTVDDNALADYYSAGSAIDGNQDYLRVPLAKFEPSGTSADPPAVNLDTALSYSPALERAVSSPPPAQDVAAASSLFHGLWSKGETMVVDVSPKDLGFQAWSPAKFAASVATVSCIVASNRTGIERGSTVGTFFSNFGKGDATGESVKIKDWPSSSDFETGLPECFKMYMNSLPFGSVTRRDGVLNIAAHYPTNANPPDLGPKGYFSEISDDEPGGNGSTKLHMDVADAVNLMLWAGPTSAGGPGFAAWDLFRAEDADKIRDFLYELIAEFKGRPFDEVKANTNDPIHGQNFFLDRALRQRLAESKGVRPWRIYQKPGEVVFIPAGCAHQVCNFADCIKIASDFVSLENVQRCEKLTDEFRLQTKDTKLWRTDVLQLKSQLLWAWRSCERFDKPQTGEVNADQEG